MRFLHTADIHLGAVPDRGMPWSEERSQAIWNTFRKLIEIAAAEDADLFLIAGDLFHRQPLEEECRRVDDLFALIPQTHIVIIAGNHDYITDTSLFLHYPWSSHVHILSSEKMSSVFLPELNTEVHGLSYHSPEITEYLYDDIRLPKDDRRHILLAHGGDRRHIPIHLNALTDAGFDYIALGHQHQPRLAKTAPLAYCGSPEPTDREDMGTRGYILGTLSDQGCAFRWYPCASAQYTSLPLTVTPDMSESELLEQLQHEISADSRSIFRIILNGYRSPGLEVPRDAILQLGRVVDLSDHTIPIYDFDAIRREHAHDLIARFIDSFSPIDPNRREYQALCYGLKALMQAGNEENLPIKKEIQH